MSKEKITSEELKNKNTVNLDGYAIDFSKYTFWYYTRIQTVEKILVNQCIFVSNLCGMNDLDECNLHKADKDRVHCLCFCNSDSEKIPMWYLYSGIAGQGCSLGITPGLMLKFIRSIKEVKVPDTNVVLRIGKDFDIEYGWVYYQNAQNPTQVRYRNKWYEVVDAENFVKENYFVKSYPWEYEREFRIVFHNKTETVYDKISVDISILVGELKLKVAPEFPDEIQKSDLPYDGLEAIESKKFSHSALKVRMALFNRNYDSFVDYISTNRDTITTDNICTLCKAINCQNNKCKRD